MAELKALSLDVIKSATDKANYDTEFAALRTQLWDVAQETFNGVSLFSSAATFGDTKTKDIDFIEVLTSERGSAGSKVSLAKIQLLSAVTVKGQDIDNYTVAAHGDDDALAVSTNGAGASTALSDFSVDSFILGLQNVATLRAENGATSSRLQFALEQLESAKVNMEAANSRIVDTDVAQESTRFARYSILVQAGAAMLSQANNTQASVMQMLLL